MTLYKLEPDERLLHSYFEGRAQLLMGNPNSALEHLQRASALEDEAGSPSYTYKLALAQCYGALGRYPQAILELSPSRRACPEKAACLDPARVRLLLTEAEHLQSAPRAALEALHAEGYSYRAKSTPT